MVDTLGILFIALDILFVLFILFLWDRDKASLGQRVAPLRTERRPSTLSEMNTDLLKLEQEWLRLIEVIENVKNNAKLANRIRDELPFTQSKIISLIRRSLHDINPRPTIRAIDEYDRVLDQVNSGVTSNGRLPVESSVYNSCLEMALKNEIYVLARTLLGEIWRGTKR